MKFFAEKWYTNSINVRNDGKFGKDVIFLYQIGDYVIKFNNGVCRVEDIMHLDMPGTDRNRLYYLLIPKDCQSAKVYVPVDAESRSLRKALSKEEAWEIIRKIPETEKEWSTNDKQREQEYKAAIQSCNPTELVGIIKNLYSRKQIRRAQGKKSTSTDERYFKLAEDSLYSELAFAIGREKQEMKQIIAQTIAEIQEKTEG